MVMDRLDKKDEGLGKVIGNRLSKQSIGDVTLICKKGSIAYSFSLFGVYGMGKGS